jgi:hypothetical protein
VAEDSIKVRANKKWTIKKHNQHWTEDTERKQTKQKTQHIVVLIKKINLNALHVFFTLD